jgi:hypothetical protein
MNETDKHSAMFIQLVLMLHGAAMQHMGKLKSPVTGGIERDLHAARTMIDLLEMVKARTNGNLSEEEAKMLDQVLRELRLNYVDEAGKSESIPSAEGGSPS